MEVINNEWTFDGLVSEYHYEKVREEYLAYSAKHELIHELIRELMKKGDFDSDAFKLLQNKREFISARTDTLSDIQRYLWNLKDGMPFNVSRSVGRCMVRFGLTAEQSQMLLNIHKSHMAAMGTENQKKHHLAYVQKVVWDDNDDCLKVYYDDIWWHYDRRGQWY